ncbi:hypothetical protein BKA70DRAFT_745068 [Coprinopsis sp. MPI-PUGE-AT-0042]|nr:hypothetical protein BKA70DRAFT_745068 [Coprinopsis sp. MPI-PUGE-AT-0042]
MEGVVQHSCSERDELHLKLQASESTVAEERARVLELRAEADAAKALARNWEADNQRLREELQVQTEEIKSLKEKVRRFEENLNPDLGRPLAEELTVKGEAAVALSSKRPLEDEHPAPSSSKRPRMASENAMQPIEQGLTGDGVEDAPSRKGLEASSVTPGANTSLSGYLSCESLKISPAPSFPKVSTAFITSTYETTNLHSFSYIPAHKNPVPQGASAVRCIAWPSVIKNPLTPHIPGHHGLLFLPMHEPVPGVVSLVYLTPSQGKKKPEFATYLGEYETRDMEQITTEWYITQQERTRYSWAKHCFVLPSDEAAQLRARVALRKQGTIIRQNREDDLKVQAEVAAAAAGQGRPVDIHDMVMAFVRGEELPLVRVVQVTCVGYDRAFVSDVEAKWPVYQTEMVEAEKAAKTSKSYPKAFPKARKLLEEGEVGV